MIPRGTPAGLFGCDFDVTVVQPRQDWDGYNDPGPLDCPT